ncbi:MAG: Rhodanese-related sulfurtransferase [Rhodobacteraceae bacterium HLUCCA08]|nr:MAG: Rhodanese-related sulfurtransferase [Rhodobacteraceae bacterium HLUCCA08]
MRIRRVAACCAAVFLAGLSATAQEVAITEGKPDATFTLKDQTFRITRNQDTEAVLTGEFARTSRECPPFCIQPMRIADGVDTIAELELIALLETDIAAGRALLIDSRLPDWYGQGTIPGAVNVPFSTLDPQNPYRDEILQALGAVPGPDGGLDFTGALELVLFCNGPWCSQSPQAITNLLEAGYPADKLLYYRGGMQGWQSLGLTVHVLQEG